ncbi:hypothetical protein EUGRSUZ_E03067 [Eucalyptus grandis]|uniref:TIR domain-containing protein n=2 Tax=Eucalyptus grandis TaxID=71139 RepID=A0A059C879_EUCGR|nr:hypothetical protein EUGRSUZ_E03067 [Eucalyptus grandis]
MKRNYHVFLSFRGTDVRQGFLSHLYAALDQRGIYTFVDSEELRKGEEISPMLMRAIQESHIAIIVFSEDYASSRWCLEELLKIMECKEKNGLMVFPVFYEVEPREVREGRESYKRAMDNHEYKFGKDSENVKRWKKAFSETGSLSGWELNDRDEADLIQCIVKELSIHLNRTPLHVAKYPKGSADDDVLMIGLWGPGGIGKTAIAKALYNAMTRQFQVCSFLEQVREKSHQSNGLVTLQKDLLSEILVHPLTVYSVARGISLIQERLCCKKVLLVLDDVDHMNQLNALAGKGNWFGKGSRIIFTSRDKHLLTSHDKNYVYEVKTLKDDEARDLFGQHAFTNSNKIEIRRDLIDGALHYADSLPLALEVLGSFLRGRNEAAWESALHKLSKSPDQTINRVLKTSFDGLDDNEREIFLDIACFFKGNEIEYIQEVLDSCDFNATIGIEILIERSLIKNERGYLQMHDLVQLIGMNIVKQECCDDPGKRSRLWLLEDVEDIFYHNTAQVRLPNELRWLEWSNAPNLEFDSSPNKLVRLNVWKSHIKQLVGNFQLEVLSLESCSNFSNFPNTLRTKSLQILRLSGCSKLEKFPDIDGEMEHLKRLYLHRTGIKELLASIQNLISMEWMDLAFCENLVRLPSHIYKLKNLVYLKLSGCSNLIIFPKNVEDSIDPDVSLGFRKLKFLILKGCDLSKVEFLESTSSFPELEHLNLSYNKFTHLPTCINKYYRLRRLKVKGCELLQEIPQLPPNFNRLSAPNCKSLQKLPDFLWDSGDSTSCLLLRKGVNMDDVAYEMGSLDVVISGREMPKWIQPCKEDSIFFMIPQDLYDEIKGLAFCVVLSPEEGKVVDVLWNITLFVNGQEAMAWEEELLSIESDHVWLYYDLHFFEHSVKELLQNDRSHFQVCFKAKQGSIKKCGFRLICEQKEDNPRVVFPAPPADGSNVNVFSEDSEEDNSTGSEEETPIETDAEESSSPLTKKIRRS